MKPSDLENSKETSEPDPVAVVRERPVVKAKPRNRLYGSLSSTQLLEETEEPRCHSPLTEVSEKRKKRSGRNTLAEKSGKPKKRRGRSPLDEVLEKPKKRRGRYRRDRANSIYEAQGLQLTPPTGSGGRHPAPEPLVCPFCCVECSVKLCSEVKCSSASCAEPPEKKSENGRHSNK